LSVRGGIRLSVVGLAFAGLACAGLGALASGCTVQQISVAGTPGAGGASGTGVGTGTGGTIGTFSSRKVDLLFVVDDSSATSLLHANMIRNFPTLMAGLKVPGGAPDLHLAVVSTDLGAGDGSVPGCSAGAGSGGGGGGGGGGKKGAFQYAGNVIPPATTPCQTGLASGATFIADDGAGVRNYSGNLEDVFACVAALGESGCGFEHQLAAITRALGADGAPAPTTNQGFLRADAYLLIVLVTDEDDCSAQADSSLYDTIMNMTVDSPLGLLSSYRCNEFGHLCRGARPPRLPPNGDASQAVTLDGCMSAEDQGMLIPVAKIVSQLRALKPFPDRQILVAAIAGPPSPYAVHWTVRPGDPTPRAHVGASCTGSDGRTAAPAVRIAEFVRAFNDRGVILSACDASFGPALAPLAAALNPIAGPDYP